MKILALETSTDACSVAIRIGGEVLERHVEHARRHAQLIVGMIEAVLGEAGAGPADLDGIAVGHGPGSFTGVRIALSVGQGLSLATEVPLIGISSLAALAQRGLGRGGVGEVVVAQDARMGEVYLGRYRRGPAGEAMPVEADAIVAPEPLMLAPDTLVMGSAAIAYPPLAGGHALLDTETLPHAGDVAALAAAVGPDRFVAPECVEPVYLRQRVTHTSQGNG